jgi:hypothetical protein
MPPIIELEQRLSAAGLVSIALNAQNELCILQKLGGVPFSTDEMLKLTVTKAKETNCLGCRKIDWDEKLKCDKLFSFFLAHISS